MKILQAWLRKIIPIDCFSITPYWFSSNKLSEDLNECPFYTYGLRFTLILFLHQNLFYCPQRKYFSLRNVFQPNGVNNGIKKMLRKNLIVAEKKSLPNSIHSNIRIITLNRLQNHNNEYYSNLCP